MFNYFFIRFLNHPLLEPIQPINSFIYLTVYKHKMKEGSE